MKKATFLIIALSSATMLSANCPGGNCPYQGQSQGYQDQRYDRYNQQGNQGYNQQYQDERSDRYNQPSYQSQRSSQYNQPSYQDQRSNQYYDQGSQGQRSDQYNRGSQQNYDHNYNDQRSNQNRDRDGYYTPSEGSNANSSYNANNSNKYDRSNRLNDSNYVNDDRNAPRATKAITDEDISEDVREAVSASWLSSGYPDVTFDVNNGTVNLRGFVKTLEEKADLEKAVRKIDGVRQVRNELSVRNEVSGGDSRATNKAKTHKVEKNYLKDSAATDSDRLINSKLRDRLSGWFTRGYETIVLNTSNGVVTITGYVENADDIQKVNNEARNVEGVKSVNNNVTVQRR